MKQIAILVALAGALTFSGLALASGEGDHHHPEEETTPDSTVVEEQPAHDNANGHHDRETPATLESEYHHDEPMEDHHDGIADDHHNAAAGDHHDAMPETMGHDHSAHEDGTWADGPIERALAWAGKFHPALTNFPIALLIMALLAEAWGMVRGGTPMRAVGRFLAISGGVAAIVTAAAGWLFVGFNIGGDDQLLSIHRLVGSLAGVSGLAAMIVGLRTADADGRNLLRVTVLIAAALVAYNGYLGGQMLYGIDHYDWPA